MLFDVVYSIGLEVGIIGLILGSDGWVGDDVVLLVFGILIDFKFRFVFMSRLGSKRC